MEAKVDIRKLQLLNDRITQTIDALNQVRLTVHGLGHSSPYAQMNPYLSAGLGQQPWGQFGGQQPWGQFGGQQPIGQSYGVGVNPFQTGTMGGIQHSSPLTQSPLVSQVLGGQYGNTDLFENQYLLVRASDPNRISATFPFAFQPHSPLTGGGY